MTVEREICVFIVILFDGSKKLTDQSVIFIRYPLLPIGKCHERTYPR